MVATKGIHALGLRNTITHTELMKIDDEWKVIEIGVRMGGFRHSAGRTACARRLHDTQSHPRAASTTRSQHFRGCAVVAPGRRDSSRAHGAD